MRVWQAEDTLYVPLIFLRSESGKDNIYAQYIYVELSEARLALFCFALQIKIPGPLKRDQRRYYHDCIYWYKIKSFGYFDGHKYLHQDTCRNMARFLAAHECPQTLYSGYVPPRFV